MNEELTQKYDGLIKNIAKQFYNVDFEDLLQAGRVGLIKAYKRYKQDGTCKFSTYAYMDIYGEMYQLACSSKSLKINGQMLKLYKQTEKMYALLCQNLNRIPTSAELAESLGIDLYTLNQVMMLNNPVTSIEATNDENRPYTETIAFESNINAEDKIIISECLDTLTEEEHEVIYNRYYQDLTQMQIAKMMNIPQARVSRLEAKSLSKMRQFVA